MSRLVNIGPGERIDRLSILSRKIVEGERQGKDTAHFRQERAVLVTELRASNGIGSYLEEAFELAAVNAALWDRENELREMRKRHESSGGTSILVDAAEVAFAIQDLNDARARLVEAINTKTGNHLGSEKIDG